MHGLRIGKGKFIFLFKKNYYFYVYEWFAYMHVCTMCIPAASGTQKMATGFCGAGVTDGFESLCWC